MAGVDPRGPKKKSWQGKKTTGLSTAELQKAGRIVGKGKSETVTARELKRATQDFVNIGSTRWMTAAERGGKGVGGLLVDASGRPVTGTVTLPGGKSAVYVRGKRIGVGKSSGGGAKPKTPDRPANRPSVTRLTGPSAMQLRKAQMATARDRSASQAPVRRSTGGLTVAQRKRLQQGRKPFQSGTSRSPEYLDLENLDE